MNSPQKSGLSQPFRITYSQTFLRIEIALQLLVLTSIVQLIDWPEVMLFVMLFLLLGWQFFNKNSIRNQYSDECYIQISNNPPSIKWVESEHESSFPVQAVKILITRWFILLQLGQRQTKVRRILLADSFESLELYSFFRQKIIETKLC